MKPEYWDAIWLGLAIGFAPLVLGLLILALYCVGLVLTFWVMVVWDCATSKFRGAK